MEFSLIHTAESSSSAFVFNHDEKAWVYTIYGSEGGAWVERVSGRYVGDYSDTGWLLAQITRWHLERRIEDKSRRERRRSADDTE